MTSQGNPPRQSWRLVLTDVGDPVPVNARLRRMLKGMLRAYRFRCLSIEATPNDRATVTGGAVLGNVATEKDVTP